jgi:hypothetical protein
MTNAFYFVNNHKRYLNEKKQKRYCGLYRLGMMVLQYKGTDGKGFRTAVEARKETEDFIIRMNEPPKAQEVSYVTEPATNG